jgi:SynChlorMet cassette protein ScmD
MEPSAKPIANPIAVLREEFDDWAVLFNPDSGQAVGINPVGVAIWKLLDGQHTVADIVAEIKHHFADVPDAAPEHVAAFVNDLASGGFVGHELGATSG